MSVSGEKGAEWLSQEGAKTVFSDHCVKVTGGCRTPAWFCSFPNQPVCPSLSRDATNGVYQVEHLDAWGRTQWEGVAAGRREAWGTE